MSNNCDVNVSLSVEGAALNTGETGVLRGKLWAGEGKKICCEKICIYISVGDEDTDLFFNDGGTIIESKQMNASKLLVRRNDTDKIMLQLSTPDRGQRPLSKPLELP